MLIKVNSWYKTGANTIVQVETVHPATRGLPDLYAASDGFLYHKTGTRFQARTDKYYHLIEEVVVSPVPAPMSRTVWFNVFKEKTGTGLYLGGEHLTLKSATALQNDFTSLVGRVKVLIEEGRFDE